MKRLFNIFHVEGNELHEGSFTADTVDDGVKKLVSLGATEFKWDEPRSRGRSILGFEFLVDGILHHGIVGPDGSSSKK